MEDRTIETSPGTERGASHRKAGAAERLYWNAILAWQSLRQSRFPWQPPAVISRIQSRRVREIIAYAYRFVPYYRKTLDRLGLSPLDFRSAEDLARLPILDPVELRRSPREFVSNERSLGRYAGICSAGSTGVPRKVYHTTRALMLSAAHGERSRRVLSSVLGRTFGYKSALIIPLSSTTGDIRTFWSDHAFLPRNLPVRQRVFSMFDPVEKTAALLDRFQPDMIYTYGNYLEMLAAHFLKNGLPFPKPKLVAYSSSVLSDSVRAIFEKKFGIPVFSLYQAVEALKIGFECEQHRGLHLNIDLYAVRVVDRDGRPLPENIEGEVVVSNLINRGTVLLNYRIGDMAALLPGRCPCGRSLPLLSFVEGRSDDRLVLPSGRVIHPQSLCKIFRQEPDVWQYQIVQEAGGDIHISLAAPEASGREELRKRIAMKTIEVLKEDMRVRVEMTESVLLTPGGKRRAVVSFRGRDGEERSWEFDGSADHEV